MEWIAPVSALEVCYASALHSEDQTIRLEHRLRRSNGSSSDDDPAPASGGFIEEDFRVGGPNLCEGPCETLSHKYDDTLAGPERIKLELELLDLVRETNPEINEIRFCGRRSLWETGEPPSITALFCGKSTRQDRRGWIAVARRVRQRLLQRGLSHMKVEILDPRFSQPLILFPCFTRDMIFPIWGDVVESILSTVDLSGVYTIGCYRIGCDSDDRDKSSPTILVGVDRMSNRNWKNLREALVRILDDSRLPTVAILLRKDTGIFRRGRARNNIPVVANCTKEVSLGYCISPRKQINGHGTLGGWVELQNPKTGAWVPFGLTCTHCVLPEELFSDKPIIDDWKWNGIPFANRKPSELLLLDSPSRSELQKGIKALDELIGQYIINQIYQKVEKAKREDEFVMPFEETTWKDVSGSIKAFREKQDTLKEFLEKGSFAFGTVMAASGIQTGEARNPMALPSLVDWALIRPVSGTVGNNDASLSRRPVLTLLHGFCARELQANEILAKIGYATGFTEGRYVGLKTVVFSSRMVNGKEVKAQTMEHTITSALFGSAIVKIGDSGSLIF